MARLSVTIDERTTRELDQLRPDEVRGIVSRAMECLPVEDSRCLTLLARSVRDLGDEPSSSSIVREALGVYLGLLRETRERVALQTGYALLAQDHERDDVVEAMSKRAPDRWSEEE